MHDTRIWLYHRAQPARIFNTATDDIDDLHDDGWRDTPDKAAAVTGNAPGPADIASRDDARARKAELRERLRKLGAEIPGSRASLTTLEAALAAAEEAAA